MTLATVINQATAFMQRPDAAENIYILRQYGTFNWTANPTMPGLMIGHFWRGQFFCRDHSFLRDLIEAFHPSGGIYVSRLEHDYKARARRKDATELQSAIKDLDATISATSGNVYRLEKELERQIYYDRLCKLNAKRK